MSASHFAFGHFSCSHLAMWHFAGSGGVLFFHGKGSIHAVDWTLPIGGASAGQAIVHLPMALQSDAPHVIAARRVAASGVIEAGNQVYAFAQADQAGELMPPPIERPQDASVRQVGGQLTLEFTWDPQHAAAQAEWFEIYRDEPDGRLNVQSPVATLQAVCGQLEYLLVLPADQGRPRRLGICACSGPDLGPLAVVSVPSVASLPNPILQ